MSYGFSEEDWERADDWYDRKVDCMVEMQPTTPTGTQILSYAITVYGKPWRMNRDDDIPHRTPFLLAQLVDDIVSILTWRALPLARRSNSEN